MFDSRETYRKAWNDAYTIDPDVPLNVDIEIASLCNLTCPMCFIPDPAFDSFIRTKAADGKPKARIMPTEMAIRIIDQCADIGVPALKMNWRGESTLHPDYAHILNYAGAWGKDRRNLPVPPSDWSRGICGRAFHEILVNTNANCPDSAIEGLVSATKVMVSLDSMVPATYAVMRRGGSLEKAKATIKELIRRKHPNLWIRRVLTRDNDKEPFAQSVRAEFGESVHISEHYCFDRNVLSHHERSGCDHDVDVEGGRTYCGYPSQRIVVASTGLCYPCCIDLHEEMPVGDITKESLESIWNSQRMRDLRSELRSNTFRSKACQNCESWMSRNSPQRNFVQDVEVKI